MNTCVIFTSTLFKPFLPGSAQVNPECYGAELAWWLSGKLASKNTITSYPNYEDWGWFLEYLIEDNAYWICCGNITGTEDQWQIFVEPQAKGLFSRKKPPIDIAAPVLKTIDDLLRECPEIYDIKWHER
ncbi:MAG: hypothetical protein ACN4GW_16720 [Desulforhopalus sp.]